MLSDGFTSASASVQSSPSRDIAETLVLVGEAGRSIGFMSISGSSFGALGNRIVRQSSSRRWTGSLVGLEQEGQHTSLSSSAQFQ
jgi:hypothetical protein